MGWRRMGRRKQETGKWKVGKQPDDCFNGEGGNDALVGVKLTQASYITVDINSISTCCL